MSSVEEPALLSPQTKKSMRAYSKTGKNDTVAPPFEHEESGLTIRRIPAIAAEGNLILKVKDVGTGKHHLYLVTANLLRDASSYFSALLDPTKFVEGIGLNEKMKGLVEKYGNHGLVPLADLPIITIDDVGEVPPKASTEAVFTLFLCILHKLVVPWGQPDWSFLALLAIVADRFDALKIVAEFVDRRDWIRRSFSWDEKTPLSIPDEKLVRQQILVGLLFRYGPLLKKQTATLIVADSVLWTKDEVPAKVDRDVLWWGLPHDMEDEMACRRAYLLETISSLQQHFINLYIFQPNQCKYGYDSSPACNSFQLGEMIRFFSRHDTLSLESTFCPPQQSPAMRGNILELMATLRSCPGYQIDSNHAHCGIRARFISGLELIMPLAQVGICARCWAEDAEAESWEDSPVGGRWNYTPRSQSGQLFGGCEAHRKAKVMYTAEERDWAFQPS